MSDYTELKEAAGEVRSENRNYPGEGWHVNVGDGSEHGTLWRVWIDREGLRRRSLIAEFTNLADDADRAFVAAADPPTILAIIADLEETKVHWVHKGLRLAAAGKVIEKLVWGLEQAHLYVVNAGYPALQYQELTKLGFDGSIDLAGHLARALAAHDDWKKGVTDASQS